MNPGGATRPVAVLQMHPIDGPGYLEQHLASRGFASRLLRLYGDDPVPEDPAAYAGLALLGGPVSVNDGLPYLRAVEALLRAAVAGGVPILGHCLGGQLLAHALGARVGPAATVEIGWSEIAAAPNHQARSWFGRARFPMFQWHYESFELPPGATLIASGTDCANQAFVVDERHIGMQFHCEITTAKLDTWLDAAGLQEIERARGSHAVHDAARIRAESTRLATSREVAIHIYDRWLSEL